MKSPIILGFEGTQLTKKLRQHLRKMDPAGIVLFKRNIHSLEQTKVLVHNVREDLGDIIVAIDHEGGVVNRFPEDIPVPPSPMALNKANQSELTHKACRIQAELLSYLGIDLNFVPVVDLDSGSDNLAIGTRAYSNLPEEVIEYGRICVQEHQNLNIATTAKHFPGHGRTISDSHFSIGQVDASKEDLWESDLVPYRLLIQEKIPAIMTAHLYYPALDGAFPATLSKSIIKGLLRGEMQYKGLVISDCIEMAGISEKYSVSEMVHLGLQSGIDLWITSFSLKKSLGYQLELKQELDIQLSRNLEKKEEIHERLKVYLEQYCKFTKQVESLILPEELLSIYQQTLTQFKSTQIPQGYDSYYLIELSNNENRGINTDVSHNSVTEQIKQNCPNLYAQETIFENEIKEFIHHIHLANQQGCTLLLLTANGFRLDNYPDLISQLKNANSSVHIALLDSKDLSGLADQEWATWGFNSWTGKMIVENLLRISK